MTFDLDGYFELLGNVQKRRGGNKTHREIRDIINKQKRYTANITADTEPKEITKKGQQLKLLF